jgi:hypothetical protein
MNTIDQLSGQPELTETIAGHQYHFSALTVDALARLQAWMRDNIPDPMESVKPALEGLAPEDRQYLLNEARKERLSWPPDIMSHKGKIALMSSDSGTQELFLECVHVHHPEITREGSYKIYWALVKEPNFKRKILKIIGLALHLQIPDEGEEPSFPKDLKLPTKNGSTGSYSTGAVNAS